jgi:hypothetical protein
MKKILFTIITTLIILLSISSKSNNESSTKIILLSDTLQKAQPGTYEILTKDDIKFTTEEMDNILIEIEKRRLENDTIFYDFSNSITILIFPKK